MTRARAPQCISPFSILETGPFLALLNTAILGSMQVQELVTDMSKLNVHEQTFICVDTFLKEAEADGVGHFFYYDSAPLYEKVLVGLDEIGARDARIGLSRYVAQVFDGEVPRSVAARQNALDALDETNADQAERMVGDLSEATSLLAIWARAHREHFRLE